MKLLLFLARIFMLSGLIVAVFLLGCGGSDLTGGSIPPGNPGQTRLVGTVVDEEDPNVLLADAEVEVTLEDGTSIVTRTDATGRFVVELPINKRCNIRVRPPSSFAWLYGEKVDTFITDASEIWLVIPVPHKEMMMPAVVELRISPEEVVLKVRERVQFQVSLNPLPQRPLRPVWSVHGGIGVVTPDGLFVATRPGQGFVRVRIGKVQAEARITVLPE